MRTLAGNDDPRFSRAPITRRTPILEAVCSCLGWQCKGHSIRECQCQDQRPFVAVVRDLNSTSKPILLMRKKFKQKKDIES